MSKADSNPEKSEQSTQKERQKIVQNLYALADMMGASIFQNAQYADEWLGCQPRQAQIGPWQLSFSNSGWTDQCSDEGCSIFLKMKGDLWAYGISEKGHLQLVLFDGKTAGITRDKAPLFGARSIGDTLVQIEDYAIAYFTHNSKAGWQEVKKEEF